MKYKQKILCDHLCAKQTSLLFYLVLLAPYMNSLVATRTLLLLLSSAMHFIYFG